MKLKIYHTVLYDEQKVQEILNRIIEEKQRQQPVNAQELSDRLNEAMQTEEEKLQSES